MYNNILEIFNLSCRYWRGKNINMYINCGALSIEQWITSGMQSEYRTYYIGALPSTRVNKLINSVFQVTTY